MSFVSQCFLYFTRSTFRSSLVLFLLWPSAASVASTGITIGPTDKKGCIELCEDLVYDCARYVLAGDMCTLFSHEPPHHSGFATPMPSQEKCDAFGQAAGMNVRWQRNSDRDGGWCIEGPPKGPTGTPPAPDLTKELSTDWGTLHLSRDGNRYEGYYREPNRTMAGTLKLEGNQWVFEGEWGRKDDPDHKGGFRFVFSSQTAFNGLWWYDWSERDKKPWNSTR